MSSKNSFILFIGTIVVVTEEWGKRQVFLSVAPLRLRVVEYEQESDISPDFVVEVQVGFSHLR